MAKFQAVIFDMDGTIIEPLLDFSAIRSELGIGAGEGILEAIDAMSPDAAGRAGEYLVRQEVHAANKAVLIPGALETINSLRAAGIKTALLTRNVAEAMNIVLERFPLPFDLTWSREQGPIKPEPDGVLAACRELGVSTAYTACVGDFLYDIQAARAAGCVSILLARGERPDFAETADYVITQLGELLDVLNIKDGTDLDRTT